MQEVIEIPGYTIQEKLGIAQTHLVPKQINIHGLSPTSLKFPQALLLSLIESYTREAGVRQLERCIGAICRYLATKLVQGETVENVNKEIIEKVLGVITF
jgi:ATP-dependent Lon protease